ncbi:MAG TPA: AI-2E family transporter [Candidatus Omnitrophota bacterium]|nr:AI-2E family transporter [Candidatus Omnitrophota bacterium]HRY85819.1 AI-2E family transporter [Candidatus Omnitrophota bacterium]
MKREQFISFFFIGILAFIIYEVFRIFSPFFTAIFWAAILAFAFYPLYAKLRKLFPRRSGSIALLMTIVVFLIVIPPLIMILINMTKEVIEFSQWAYTYVREGRLEKLIEQVREVPWLHKVETHIVASQAIKDNLSSWVLGGAKKLGNLAASQAGTFTKNMFFVFLNVFFMSFLTFVFFKHGERIYNFIYEIAPFERETKKDLFKQIHDTFVAVIRGQLLTSVAQASVAGILFTILGVPIPLFFTFLIFLTSLIPVLGAASVWFPIALYFLVTHLYVKAIILFLVGFFGISLLDNIMKPAIIGEKTKLPYFLLFFGIMGGMKLYGLMGIFLAPVVLSLFFALIKIYRGKYV